MPRGGSGSCTRVSFTYFVRGLMPNFETVLKQWAIKQQRMTDYIKIMTALYTKNCSQAFVLYLNHSFDLHAYQHTYQSIMSSLITIWLVLPFNVTLDLNTFCQEQIVWMHRKTISYVSKFWVRWTRKCYERCRLSLGGASGLVVMGGDSCPEGRGFESLHHILNEHFFTYICCKNCNVCLKRQKN